MARVNRRVLSRVLKKNTVPRTVVHNHAVSAAPPEDSWLLKLLDARSIGFLFFAASIFAIEFTEMWAVKVPRTVALSKFDILSSSFANIPVLLMAVAIAAVLIAVFAMVVFFGLAGFRALAGLLAMVALGIADFFISAGRWLYQMVHGWYNSRDVSSIKNPDFGLLHFWRTDRFQDALKTIAIAWGNAKASMAKSWSIVSHRPRRGSWEQLGQVIVTLAVFAVIWLFAWFNAAHYRAQIYDFKRINEKVVDAAGEVPQSDQTAKTDSVRPLENEVDQPGGPESVNSLENEVEVSGQQKRWTCGPTKKSSFLSFDAWFDFFQPVDAGYLVLTKDFTARSSLSRRIKVQNVLPASDSKEGTSPVIVSGCVTYVGDYGDWAFIVPRHEEGPEGGFLIRRSMIQEFTPLRPDGANGETGSSGPEFKSPEEMAEVIKAQLKETLAELETRVDKVLPMQVESNAAEMARVLEKLEQLERRVAIGSEDGDKRLVALINKNGQTIAALKAEIAALRIKMEAEAASAEQLSALKAASISLGASVETLEARLAAFGARLEGLSERTEPIGGRLTQQSEAVRLLSEKVSALSTSSAGSVQELAGVRAELARIEKELSLMVGTGLKGHQSAIDTVGKDLGALSRQVKLLIEAPHKQTYGSPDSKWVEALNAMDAKIVELTKGMTALARVVDPLPPQIGQIKQTLGDLPSPQDQGPLKLAFAELRNEITDLKALVSALPKPDRDSFEIKLNEIEVRLEQVEKNPMVVVVQGAGTAKGSGSGSESRWPDDQYSGVPTRLVDAVDQIKGLGGTLNECYNRSELVSFYDFDRNQIALKEGTKKTDLLQAVEKELDLPNRNVDSKPKLVFLKGGADSLGTPEVNRRISEQRAAAVQTALEDHLGAKLKNRNIEFVSVGIGENVAILDPKRKAGARSVQVIICEADGT